MSKVRKRHVYLYPEPCDMRLGFSGLPVLVRDHFGSAASAAHRYLFINRARNRAKVLSWDGTGVLITTKRLEKGTFVIPSGRVALAEDEFLNCVGPPGKRGSRRHVA
jgi:transposase